MNIFKPNKHRIWVRLITLIVITTFLCQNVAWAAGEAQIHFRQRDESKLSVRSQASKIVDEWNIISLILTIYDLYGFREGEITAKEIDSTGRIKEILKERLRENGNLEAYEKYIDRIIEISLEGDSLIYVKYLINREELLFRFARRDKKDNYIILAESDDVINGHKLQIVSDVGQPVLGIESREEVGATEESAVSINPAESVGTEAKRERIGRLWTKTFLYSFLFNSCLLLALFISNGINFGSLSYIGLVTGLIINTAMAVVTTYNLAAARLIWNDSKSDGWERENKHYSTTPPIMPSEKPWPTHTVMLPIYNEDWGIVKKTLDAAGAAVARYNQTAGEGKANIVVCDDGLMGFTDNNPTAWLNQIKTKRDEGVPLDEMENNFLSRIEYCEQHGIAYVARPKHQPGVFIRRGLFKKASNLNHTHKIADLIKNYTKEGLSYEESLLRVKGDDRFKKSFIMGQVYIGNIVTLLDNDSIMPPDSIVKTVPEFVLNPNLGYTQNTTSVTNSQENYFTRLVADSTNIAWKFLYALSARYGFVRFGGHNGMIRKRVLEEIGYWPEEVVAEDTWMSKKIAQLENNETGQLYYGKFINYDNEAFGEELPTSVSGYKKMINKFSFGVTQLTFNPIRDWFKKGIFTKDFKAFLMAKGIPVKAKIDIVLHLFKYFVIIPVVIGSIFIPIITYYSVHTQIVLPLIFFSNLFAFCSYTSLVIISNYKERKNENVRTEVDIRAKTRKIADYLKSTILFLGVFPEMIMGIAMRLLNVNKIFNPTPKGEIEEMPLRILFLQIFKNNVAGIILGLLFIIPFTINTLLGNLPAYQIMYFSFSLVMAISWITTPFLYEPLFVEQVKEKLSLNRSSRVYKKLELSSWRRERREFLRKAAMFVVALSLIGIPSKIEGQEKPRSPPKIDNLVNWIVRNINTSTKLPPSFNGDPHWYNAGFLYDHAVATLALHLAGRRTQAEDIINYYKKRYEIEMGKLQRLLDRNHVYGILRVLLDIRRKPLKGIINAVDIANNSPAGTGREWYVDGGPQYWLGLSMLQIDKNKYLKFAEELADYGLRLQDTDGGIKAGTRGQKTNAQEIDRFQYKHTEHNLDAYALFKMLYQITKKKKYKKGMEEVLRWLKKVYKRSEGYFYQGVNPQGINDLFATDVQAWSICAIGPERLDQLLGQGTSDKLIDALERKCLVQVKFKRRDGKVVTVTGFDFSDPSRKDITDQRKGYKPLVTPEWSSQVALAYYEMAAYSYKRGKKKLATEYKAKGDALVNNIMLMVSNKGDRSFLPYASEPAIPTGFGWNTSQAYATLAGTWIVFPKLKYNPFILGGGGLSDRLAKIPSLKIEDAHRLLNSKLLPNRKKDIGGEKANHREKINPHLQGWLKQNKDKESIKVIDYYQEDGEWIPYKVEYKEEYTLEMDDRGKQLTDKKYCLSEEEQKRLNKTLQSFTYDETGKRVRFRVVLDEVAVAWRGDIDHSSLVHVGERSATIWFGEGLFRDLLNKDEDTLRVKVFGHEKEHLLGRHKVDEEEDYQDLVNEVHGRCMGIEQRSISIGKARNAFETLGRSAKESNNLCSKWSSLNGAVQSIHGITKLKFAVSANVLRNAADITHALGKLKHLGETKFELIVYDVEDEKEAYVIENALGDALNLSSNITISTITKDQIDSGNIEDKIEIIKNMASLKDNEYLAIATDMISRSKTKILKDKLGPQAKDRTSIRIIEEPGEEGVISLSSILVDWIENIDTPSVKIILPTIVSVQELRERLEAQMKYAWQILSAA